MKIELNCVSKIYKSATRDAISNVSLVFDKNELIVITGKSGSGKTTLLNMISGFDKPSTGDVFYDSENAISFSEAKWERLWREKIAFVFQSENLIEFLSVYDNLNLALELSQNAECSSLEIEKALKEYDLAEKKSQDAKKLSGGEAQRVAVARAFIKSAEVVIADEPTGSLDPENATIIWQKLKQLSNTRMVIVVSHDISSAKNYADRIIEISNGYVNSDIRLPEDDVIPAKACHSITQNYFENNRLSSDSILKLTLSDIKHKWAKVLIAIVLFTIINTLILSLFNLQRNDYVAVLRDYYIQNERMPYILSTLDSADTNNNIGIKGKYYYDMLAFRLGDNNIFFYLSDVTISSVDMSDDDLIPAEDQDLDIAVSDSISDKCTVFVVPSSAAKLEGLLGSMPVCSNDIVLTDALASEFSLGTENIGEIIFLNNEPMQVSGIIKTGYPGDTEVLQKCLCAGGYYEKYSYLTAFVSEAYISSKHEEALALKKAVNLTGTDISMTNYKDLILKYTASWQAASPDNPLICGRLPVADNEVAVSKKQAERIGINTEDFTEFSYSIRCLTKEYSERWISAYPDITSFLGDTILVTGVINGSAGDYYVADNVYAELTDCYYQYYWYDGIAICIPQELNGKNTYEDLCGFGFEFTAPDVKNIECVSVFFHSVDAYVSGLLILTAVLLIGFILVFIAMSSKDNKYTIGVLRSIGVPKKDIKAVFLLDAAFIAIPSVLLSVAGVFGVYAFIVNSMEKTYTWVKYIRVLRVNPLLLTSGCLLILVLITAAAVIPIDLAAGKRPVQILKNH